MNKFNNFESRENGGAIYISNPSEISFNNNEFKKMSGNNKDHVIYLTFTSLANQIFEGNKFQNISSADGFFYIKSFDDIEYNLTFVNMNFASVQQNGGGIVNIENGNNSFYGIIFNNCVFSSCTNTNGGSILVNQDTYQYCIGLYLYKCQLIVNEATGKGGAIAFYNEGDVFIDNCDFNVNSASEGGGAIYIEPNSQKTGNCQIIGSHFNENKGLIACDIWINTITFDDDYTLELNSCIFIERCNLYNSLSCASNCKVTNVYYCSYSRPFEILSHTYINITAKSILNINNCTFDNMISSQNSYYYDGISYSYRQSDELDRSRDEYISIYDCTFDNCNRNGSAIFLNVLTLNINITQCEVKNYQSENYIFYIYFKFDSDNEIFTLKNINFTGNYFNCSENENDCGGAGIYIAKEISQNYQQLFTVQFENCLFIKNSSPANGGAFGYDIDEKLKEVDLIFKECQFDNNFCNGSGGACHFATQKSVELYNCIFENNACKHDETFLGGGALEFNSTVEMATIFQCTFSNCEAPKGSYIYGNYGLRGINISECTFNSLNEQHHSSVYLDIDSTTTVFNFEYNNFQNMKCYGEYGGAGLHIGTGTDCDITSCQFNDNLGEGQIIIPDKSEYKLNFINCTFTIGLDGIRMFYVKDEASVNFDTCIFSSKDDYSESTDRGILIFSLSEQKNSIFNNCNFSNIKCSSALDFEFSQTIEINLCKFNSVQACKNNEGGLLYIKNALSFSLTNCDLYSCGSPHSIDHSCFDLCPSVETANIINCTFEYCGRCHKGAAVYAKNISKISIINSIFLRNMGQGVSYDTLSVYVGENSEECIISNCKIHTRRSQNSIYTTYQFQVFSSKVIFTNNIFDKYLPDSVSSNDRGICGIYFSGIKMMDMMNNYFSTRGTSVYITSIEQFNSINNTWENCYGATNMFPRCLYINSSVDYISFVNNTVKNCPDVRNSLLTFSAKDIIIENCQFIKNIRKSNPGGGIGIRFDCIDFLVKFINCTFNENQGDIGGAFQIEGINSDSSKCSLEVINCTFENNEATQTGGAISFATKNGNIIRDCIFNGNSAPNNGGSIAIISSIGKNENNLINSILNCQFYEYNVSNVNAIYIMNKGVFLIENCHLITENPKSNQKQQILCNRDPIFLDSEGLIEVVNTIFDRVDSSLDFCAIQIGDNGISILHNCTFNNFLCLDGNAIKLLLSERYNEIYDNIFNNCGTSNYVVYCSGIGLDFHHNEINFDNITESCGCVKIECSLSDCVHFIHDTHFHNCQTTSKGVLNYKCDNYGILIIQNNTFENLSGNYSAFYLELSLKISVTFDNNTIINNKSGNNMYLCGIVFQEIITKQYIFKMSNNKFINNSCNSQYGGGIGILISNIVNKITDANLLIFQFENCIFENNSAIFNDITNSVFKNGNGGAVQIGISSSEMNVNPIFTGCQFNSNKADNDGGGLSLSVLGDIMIENCIFYKNVAGADLTSFENKTKNGGAIMVHSLSSLKIINCTFEENKANYNSMISSHLLFEDKSDDNEKGRGGAVIIKTYVDVDFDTLIEIDSLDKKILVENCSFKSNQAYYGYAIYIEGDDNQTTINISDNTFIDNFDKDTLHRKSSIIETEICNIPSEEILENNFFSNQNDGKKIFVNKFSCLDELSIPTKMFSESIVFSETKDFSKSEIFTETKKFSKSELFSETNYFTRSNVFTSSKTLLLTVPKSQSTNKIIYSKSFSLTYVNRRSVTFTLTYILSNTHDISYDSLLETYTMILTQKNFQSYFPYIIYYLSPLYVERNVSIEVLKRKRISSEQLIGISCGSASVFFLILGIIILAVRRHNEIINQYNEFDDISYSSEQNVNHPDDQELNDFNSSIDQKTASLESEYYSTDFWL